MNDRSNISEKLKIELLRETNYRCGYCMKNITPLSFYTEERNTEKAKNIPTYYQPYDVAHIEPFDKNDPNTNEFENLIALCKECHLKTEPVHKNSAIPKESLLELKLHWITSSGRITKIEIDSIFILHNSEFHQFTPDMHPSTFSRIREIDNSLFDLKRNETRPIKPTIVMSIPINLIFLFDRIIKYNFVTMSPEKPKTITNLTSLNTGIPIFFNNHELTLTEMGRRFCNKFSTAYKNDSK